jgi:hypothetical protein
VHTVSCTLFAPTFMCYCHLFYSIQVVLWTLWVVVGYSLVFSGFTSAFLCWSLGGTLAVIISYSIQFIVNSRDRDLQNGVLTLFLLPLSVFSAWATPHWFESLYLSLIRATEPLLLLLQSVFVVRLIVLSSNYLIGFIEEKPTLIKVLPTFLLEKYCGICSLMANIDRGAC